MANKHVGHEPRLPRQLTLAACALLVAVLVALVTFVPDSSVGVHADSTPAVAVDPGEPDSKGEPGEALVSTQKADEDAEDQASSGAGGDGSTPEYVENEVLLTYDKSLSEDDLREGLLEAGVSVEGISLVSDTLYDDQLLVDVCYAGDLTPYEVADALENNGIVTSVEPNYIAYLCDDEQDSLQARLAATSVNDPLVGSQWGLEAIGAYDAWDVAKCEGNVTVAVIDSGVDTDHVDLKDNLILNDAAYADYYSDDKRMKVGAGYAKDTDPKGHGTHVAGIISGVANNKIGVAGVSYNAQILPIKVTDIVTGGINYNALINAVSYATDLKIYATDLKIDDKSSEDLRNIRVINMSLGGASSSNNMENAIRRAHDNGILVVCAAGNIEHGQGETEPKKSFYPASFNYTVGVSALKQENTFDSYNSNSGDYVDLSAPGSAINSTLLNSSYGTKSGTSMAAPMVSGAAALLYSQDMDATPDEIEWMLEASAVDLGDSGWDEKYGYGALRIDDALKVAGTSVRLDEAKIALNAEEYTYTGSGIMPELEVVLDGKTLTYGTDYVVRTKNNIDCGTATVMVVGRGKYYGVAEVEFRIVPRDIGEVSVAPIAPQAWTGDVVWPSLDVTYDGVALKLSKDYKRKVRDTTEWGPSYVILVGIGNFTGETTKKYPFDIIRYLDKPATEEFTYNGAEVEPKLISTSPADVQEYIKVEGTTSARDAGEYTVTLTSLSDYIKWQSDAAEGSSQIEVTWKILPKPIDVPEADPDVVFTGEDVRGVPDGEGYTLSGDVTAVDVGTYMVTATLDPSGNYMWSDGTSDPKVIVYTIAPSDLAQAEISDVPALVATGGALTPRPVVTWGDVVFEENVDYLLEYENNVAAGDAILRVVGIGNYSGTLVKDFKIVPNPFTDLVDAATNVEDLVAELPDAEGITAEDADAVAAARAAYDALSDNGKVFVSSDALTRLESVEDALSAIVLDEDARDLEAAAELDAYIESLVAVGEVSLEDAASVWVARARYDSLDRSARDKVTKLEELDALEACIDELIPSDAGDTDDDDLGDNGSGEQGSNGEGQSGEEPGNEVPTGEGQVEDSQDFDGPGDEGYDENGSADSGVDLGADAGEGDSDEPVIIDDDSDEDSDGLGKVGDNSDENADGPVIFEDGSDGEIVGDQNAGQNDGDDSADTSTGEDSGDDSDPASDASIIEAYRQIAQGVIDKIDELPSVDDVTLDDAVSVAYARELYEVLSDEQKAYVPEDELAVLVACEGCLADLQGKAAEHEEDLARAREVATQLLVLELMPLDKLDVKDEDTAAKIASVRELFGGLSDTQKGLLAGCSEVLDTADALVVAAKAEAQRILLDNNAVSLGKTSYVYTGKAFVPTVSVRVGGKELVEGWHYRVGYSNNVKAGTGTVTVTGIGAYAGTVKTTFTITKAANPLTATVKKTSLSATYNASKASATAANVTVSKAQGTVIYANASTDATAKKFTVNKTTGAVTVPKATPVGTYTVKVKATAAGNANYETGYKTVTFKIVVAKAANPITAKAKKASVSATYSASKSVATAVNLTVSKAQGKVTYANASTAATAKKLTVNKTTGKVSVPKGTKAGTYTVKVKATAAGNANYKAGSKTVSYKVVVAKAANPLKATAVKRTAKLAAVKKKAVTVAAPLKVTNASKGKLSYKKASGSKFLTVNAKTGKVTVKKGTKKGTYTVKIKVTSAATTNYKAGTKTVTCKVVVK